MGHNLTDLRLKKGMSKQELSEKSGVSRRTIIRIENNLTTPRDYIQAKLANALECNINQLSKRG